MAISRTDTAILGISLIVSVGAWLVFETVLVVLVIPFIPLVLRGYQRPERKQCPNCSFETGSSEYEYCPRDGTQLKDR